MALAWQQGIARWDLLAQELPEAVLNGWVEWIQNNGLLPSQRDQMLCNIGSVLAASQGADVKPEEFMKMRLGKPWTPSDED